MFYEGGLLTTINYVRSLLNFRLKKWQISLALVKLINGTLALIFAGELREEKQIISNKAHVH